ncbi:hypothetical protein [Tissierella pigra]|uniref:hypothetical protein n=1 Tax=Tissierella pigra TaxID=2607614 RepID=UPI0012B2421A|nr:hypothetical protein [Tissierella pigra]
MNDEQFQEYRDTLHNALEEVIINIDENNKKQLHRLEDKVDKTNRDLDKLIELLEKLL